MKGLSRLMTPPPLSSLSPRLRGVRRRLPPGADVGRWRPDGGVSRQQLADAGAEGTQEEGCEGGGEGGGDLVHRRPPPPSLGRRSGRRPPSI